MNIYFFNYDIALHAGAKTKRIVFIHAPWFCISLKVASEAATGRTVHMIIELYNLQCAFHWNYKCNIFSAGNMKKMKFTK
jgi:hypothetical protein